MFRGIPFEKVLDYIASAGFEVIEINCGGYVGDTYCKPAELLNTDTACAAFKSEIESRGLKISALNAHANSLHPDPAIGEPHRDAITKAILLAEKLGVDTVITFSGCTGGGPEDKMPNWVTCPWPPDFSHTVKWQWEAVIDPVNATLNGVLDTKSYADYSRRSWIFRTGGKGIARKSGMR